MDQYYLAQTIQQEQEYHKDDPQQYIRPRHDDEPSWGQFVRNTIMFEKSRPHAAYICAKHGASNSLTRACDLILQQREVAEHDEGIAWAAWEPRFDPPDHDWSIVKTHDWRIAQAAGETYYAADRSIKRVMNLRSGLTDWTISDFDELPLRDQNLRIRAWQDRCYDVGEGPLPRLWYAGMMFRASDDVPEPRVSSIMPGQVRPGMRWRAPSVNHARHQRELQSVLREQNAARKQQEAYGMRQIVTQPMGRVPFPGGDNPSPSHRSQPSGLGKYHYRANDNQAMRIGTPMPRIQFHHPRPSRVAPNYQIILRNADRYLAGS